LTGGEAVTAGAAVARKTGKKASGGGESRRYETLVRLAEDVVADAKVVASLRGISMAEYLTETLRPIVKKALADELRKRVEGKD
jgi:hypothetical protein